MGSLLWDLSWQRQLFPVAFVCHTGRLGIEMGSESKVGKGKIPCSVQWATGKIMDW